LGGNRKSQQDRQHQVAPVGLPGQPVDETHHQYDTPNMALRRIVGAAAFYYLAPNYPHRQAAGKDGQQAQQQAWRVNWGRLPGPLARFPAYGRAAPAWRKPPAGRPPGEHNVIKSFGLIESCGERIRPGQEGDLDKILKRHTD